MALVGIKGSTSRNCNFHSPIGSRCFALGYKTSYERLTKVRSEEKIVFAKLDLTMTELQRGHAIAPLSNRQFFTWTFNGQHRGIKLDEQSAPRY